MISRAKSYIKEYINNKSLTDTPDLAETPTPNLPLKKSLQLFDFNESKISTNTSTNAITREITEYQNISIDTNLNVLYFWYSRRTKLPILYSVVRRFFVAQATSTPAERIFSASGYSVWDRRNRLSPSKVNKLMVVYQYNKNHCSINDQKETKQTTY